MTTKKKFAWHKVKFEWGKRELLSDSDFDELMDSGREDWVYHGELWLTEQEKEDFVIGDNWY